MFNIFSISCFWRSLFSVDHLWKLRMVGLNISVSKVGLTSFLVKAVGLFDFHLARYEAV
jgi:hypothetical protein